MEAVYTSKEVALLLGTIIQSHWLILPYIISYNRQVIFQNKLNCFVYSLMTLFGSQIQNRQILVSDQLLIQYFKNNGLELIFRQICTNDDSGSVEFLDVNHCTAADSVFGFVTKDFVNPTSVGRRFIAPSSVNFQINYIWRSHKITTIE